MCRFKCVLNTGSISDKHIADQSLPYFKSFPFHPFCHFCIFATQRLLWDKMIYTNQQRCDHRAEAQQEHCTCQVAAWAHNWEERKTHDSGWSNGKENRIHAKQRSKNLLVSALSLSTCVYSTHFDNFSCHVVAFQLHSCRLDHLSCWCRSAHIHHCPLRTSLILSDISNRCYHVIILVKFKRDRI